MREIIAGLLLSLVFKYMIGFSTPVCVILAFVTAFIYHIVGKIEFVAVSPRPSGWYCGGCHCFLAELYAQTHPCLSCGYEHPYYHNEANIE